MDRLSQLRGVAGGSGDATLNTTPPLSEAFMTANESSSKYFSLSEVDSTFDISPIKDDSLASTTADSETAIAGSDGLISNLSPIRKSGDMLESYKIGKQIEAANILSGGVDIFDDNDNSYDGDELVIDDNVEVDEKSNPESKQDHISTKPEENSMESSLVDTETEIKDTEVVLQIDGKNVDAIDIGNGIYLYRKEGEEELAAVQIIDNDQQQQSFKFLKVRENAEGNLEVYEEIEIEVPKEVPVKEGKKDDKNTSHVPIKDISKVMNENSSNKVAERKEMTSPVISEVETEVKDSSSEAKTELNLNGKTVKFSESRKSPVIGSYTPMTYHSTPHKEGIPLTKTMVDLQLHPNRHSDNVKKTIELHTDSCKQKLYDTQTKNKDLSEDKETEVIQNEKIEKNDVVESEEGKESLKSKENSAKEENEVSIKKMEQDNEHLLPEKKPNMPKDKSTVSVAAISTNASVFPIENPESITEINKQDIKVFPSTQIPQNKNEDTSKNSLEVTRHVGNSNKELQQPLRFPTVDKDITSSNQNLETKVKSTIVLEIQNVDTGEGEKLQGNDQPQQKKHIVKSTNEGNDVMQTCQSVVNVSVKPKIDNKELNVIHNVERKSTENNKTSSSQLNSEQKPQNDNKTSLNSKLVHDKINKLEESMCNENFYENVISKPVISTSERKSHIIEKVKLELIACKDPKREKSLETNSPPKIEHDKRYTHGKIEKVEKTIVQTKTEPKDNNSDIPTGVNLEQKPINNNQEEVPFGKWTEANRQEFLNKIKETKVPANSSNGKQIKNSNDLNRRDVLKKIDIQRQSHNTASKAQELNKINANSGSIFSNKPQDHIARNAIRNSQILLPESKIPVKSEPVEIKNKVTISKKITKEEFPCKSYTTPVNITSIGQKRKEVRNAQDLIDKTIEGMINKAFPVKVIPEESKKNLTKHTNAPQKIVKTSPSTASRPTTLDAIEMKMNELHGIPFIERPPHELPRMLNPVMPYSKQENEKLSDSKTLKVPNILSFTDKSSLNAMNDNIVELDSDDEIIEHEPITGDIEIKKKELRLKPSEKGIPSVVTDTSKTSDAMKKDSIITEKDFDKFVRRNSVTYENCLTVNYDGNEPHKAHNVIQTVVEKDISSKNYSKNETLRVDAKTIMPYKKSSTHNIQSLKNLQAATKFDHVTEDPSNKNYQSKVQKAYQSVLTAKRQLERPITIIEDKPVKVVFMDANPDFTPCQLNVQGQELSPGKKGLGDAVTLSTCDSLDSDMIDAVDEGKSHDELKIKTKHQRKQVLTPVEAPELELIEPKDLGIEVSPKKKRKTDDNKTDKISKNLVHKKSYLLGRNTVVEDKILNQQDVPNDPLKETVNRNNDMGPKETISALDNLVKAAELLENQSGNMNTSNNLSTDSEQNTPVKRGRGRPRKYPLPDGTTDKVKIPSPQKKPRLIDAKPKKPDTISEDEDSSSDEIVRVNWTMGKINENIVCPICNKLFRSENVVFKHVKHCTGPSPNRSESDKRSPRRHRQSQESDSKSRASKSDEMEIDDEKTNSNDGGTPKKRKSRDSHTTSKSDDKEKEDIIVIEDTPLKTKPERDDAVQQHESRKTTKTKILNRIVNNLVCEFCGKTFRQLSYLANHKLQHKKDDKKKIEKDTQNTNNSVFSCDVCKKDFRKLHHLVQHRIIHNPSVMPQRLLRKSSSEQQNAKAEKEETHKQSVDPSAGFRCEPCDKSFRKLHHLVEHRETHDGINRQKTTTTVQPTAEKSPMPPQCEICKKTFRKLHHLIEHKEQHAETSSEKSDDKSVKSSLSTKDIIHECPLCYMVFPNEHSLNKHTVICQRKKRQSKQNKSAEGENETAECAELEKQEDTKIVDNDEPEIVTEEIPVINLEKDDVDEKPLISEKIETIKIVENPPQKQIEEKAIESQNLVIKKDKYDVENANLIKSTEVVSAVPEKVKNLVDKEIVKSLNTPKKKTPQKDKVAPTITKRQKATNLPLPVIKESKSTVESSDDDEVRYMFNPDFKVDDTSEGKLFMKVRANKRSSLQIERPNSKELIKRRTSLQHPPKIPRLKPKPIEAKVPTNTALSKNILKAPKLEPVFSSTDSDDSDVKYSFPKAVVEKTPKVTQERTPKQAKRTQRKSMSEKRKSLSTIAKRKSLGKAVTARHKTKASPLKQVKKRSTEVEHRCDCGQLYSSAALLARHVSLAHTPPRVRRRRSPPPPSPPPPPPHAKSSRSSTDKPKHNAGIRKSSVKSDASSSNRKPSDNTRKSSTKIDAKPPDSRKSLKTIENAEPAKSTSAAKPRRYAAHRGVPVPEKMRKMMQKSAKI